MILDVRRLSDWVKKSRAMRAELRHLRGRTMKVVEQHDDSGEAGEVAIVSRDSEQQGAIEGARRYSKIQDKLPCIISVASLRMRSGNHSFDSALMTKRMWPTSEMCCQPPTIGKFFCLLRDGKMLRKKKRAMPTDMDGVEPGQDGWNM